MGVKLGLHAKLYRNTGSGGTPAWNEITNVRDVTLNLETGEADVSTRGNGGWRANIGTLKGATLEFEMMWGPMQSCKLRCNRVRTNFTTAGPCRSRSCGDQISVW